MSSLSTESTPRERLERAITVLSRVRMYWRSASAMIAVGLAIALAIALVSKRAFRSEAAIVYRETIQTSRDPQTSAARAARVAPKLKDTLYARGTLAGVIEAFGLYPEKRARSMVEAVEEMKLNVGFRAQSSDTCVVSFTYDDAHVAQQVTARLAELLIDDYRRDSLDTAIMTRDFLRRELAEASAKVDEASRALATFLAQNPQFQWGLGDSPYAPTPQPAPGADPKLATRSRASPPRPGDPELAALERQLGRVEAQLDPARSAAGQPGQPLPTSIVQAQRDRDAAAQAVSAAQAALAERLTTLTPIHPDAMAAKNRLDAARSQLAAAEGALRLLRGGGLPEPAASAGELTPERGSAFEAERRRLVRQIANRRAALARGRTIAGDAPERPEGVQQGARSAAAENEERIVELETEWHRLKLALDRSREYLKSVQANERAADMAAAAVENKSETEMVILDPAYLPVRPDRGRGRIFFAGAALTFIFAFGVAGARVLLNDTLFDAGDVSALGGPAMLATMPEIPAPPGRPERAILPAYAFQHGFVRVPGLDVSGDAEDDVTLAEDDAVESDVGEQDSAPRASAAAEGVDMRATGAALARLYRSAVVQLPWAAEPEPEVEILGFDVDPDGEGVFELLRCAPAPALAALRVLRHRLDQRRGDAPFAVAVVSPGPAEGKTTLAVRLAMTLAEAERARVLLVDGNFERPRVAAALGVRLPPHIGFSEQIRRRMLGGTRPFGVIEVAPSLAILAETSLAATYPAALHSTHFQLAMRTLRRHFDYVVIDGPAVLGSGDANVLEDVADGVLLVARANVTRASSLTCAAEQLGDRRILGVVLNGVTRRPVARKKADLRMAPEAA